MRCITGAIVQLANPPRSHEGVVLPTRHSWWSHKATVGRSEEKRESAHTSLELGTFGPTCRKPTEESGGSSDLRKERGCSIT